MLVVGEAALVGVGLDGGVELEELEVVANGVAGGLGIEVLGIDGVGREGLGTDGDCRAGSTEGNEVGVVAVMSTDGKALVILGNTLWVVNVGT